MVAVPADAAADVQQELGDVHQHGGDLVGDRLGRMEVTGVEAQHLLPRDRVAQVELVRADHVALRADAEQLAFDRVEVVLRIELLGEDRVERFGQPLAGRLAVDGRVLVAVGDPDVGDARRAERLAHRRADLAAGDAVLDPEFADPLVGMCEREPVGGLADGRRTSG